MGGLAARGFRDMTRLAGGEPAMYAGIVSTNAANIRARLEEFRARLQLISEQVEAGPEALERLFADARRARVDWEQAQRA
jgi:prephenate dehydrogenase